MPMSFQKLNNYLERLANPARAVSNVWLGAEGQVQGRYFNCSITSAFQPIRELGTGAIEAHEGFARSVAAGDSGLSLWRLLDHAASDDESIELDRLCRMLHTINFFRQDGVQADTLYLNVHDRLLGAVGSNHGSAFRRILDMLGVPVGQIVLQLPAVSAQQGWLLGYVADNYRRNGFRLALHAASAQQALGLLRRHWLAAVKLDAAQASTDPLLAPLLAEAQARAVDVIVKRVDREEVANTLRQASIAAAAPVHAQGYLFDLPCARVGAPLALSAPMPSLRATGS
jgi:EAL domain-containing protein (putative c-di-GMP-specific phosphodiesterase class I)